MHDVDALDVVVDRALARRRIGRGEGAELVLLVLEGIGVDRAERYTVLLGVGAQSAVVVDLVPRNVQGHRRGQTRVTVHLSRIRNLLERVAWRAGRREDAKARS